MGRVNRADAAAPPSSTLKHFTHPHDLHPISLYNPQALCSGCKLQSSGTMYACTPCTFTLHKSCANLPQLISHPSHGGCTLSLLTAAAYPGGRFSCNACALTDDSWHYHCDRCDYDLHVTCASKPTKIKHRFHTSCALDLTFKNPYMDAKGFSCDVCGKIGTKQWLYRCNSCEFDVHLDCATAAPPQPAALQQQRSLPPPPAAMSLHRVQFTHNASSGGMSATQGQFPAPPQQVNGFVQPHLMHSASEGAIGNLYGGNLYRPYGGVAGNPAAAVNNGRVGNGVAARIGGLGGNMVVAALQGIVQGAAQGVGQMVVEDVLGGGGGDMSSC